MQITWKFNVPQHFLLTFSINFLLNILCKSTLIINFYSCSLCRLNADKWGGSTTVLSRWRTLLLNSNPIVHLLAYAIVSKLRIHISHHGWFLAFVMLCAPRGATFKQGTDSFYSSYKLVLDLNFPNKVLLSYSHIWYMVQFCVRAIINQLERWSRNDRRRSWAI